VPPFHGGVRPHALHVTGATCKGTEQEFTACQHIHDGLRSQPLDPDIFHHIITTTMPMVAAAATMTVSPVNSVLQLGLHTGCHRQGYLTYKSVRAQELPDCPCCHAASSLNQPYSCWWGGSRCLWVHGTLSRTPHSIIPAHCGHCCVLTHACACATLHLPNSRVQRQVWHVVPCLLFVGNSHHDMAAVPQYDRCTCNLAIVPTTAGFSASPLPSSSHHDVATIPTTWPWRRWQP
jgi:hypothetical protein